MKTVIILSVALLFTIATSAFAATKGTEPRTGIARDSIILSDPAILADEKSGMYYMTGTGGKLWKSKDLAEWDGPYDVARPDTSSWMGHNPAIWAAEIHEHNGKYYYFATFTNQDIIIEENKEGKIPRRASHVLAGDSPEGPFTPLGKKDYCPECRPTLDGTFWIDTDGCPYMVFCGEWLHNDNGTMEKIRLRPDLSGADSNPKVLFRASDSPWSRERRDGGIFFNRVTDGPWLFHTDTGKLGMIWTSWIFGDYTMGVAYSESGTLDGPWIQDPEPITPPNFGHGMIFRDFSGRTLLSAHSHYDDHGRYIRRPTLWEIDLKGDRLRVVKKLDSSYRAPAQ